MYTTYTQLCFRQFIKCLKLIFNSIDGVYLFVLNCLIKCSLCYLVIFVFFFYKFNTSLPTQMTDRLINRLYLLVFMHD